MFMDGGEMLFDKFLHYARGVLPCVKKDSSMTPQFHNTLYSTFLDSPNQFRLLDPSSDHNSSI